MKKKFCRFPELYKSYMVHKLNVLWILLPSIFNPEFQCVWCNKVLWYLIGKHNPNFLGRSLQASEYPQLPLMSQLSAADGSKGETWSCNVMLQHIISPALCSWGWGPLQSITMDLCCSSVMAMHREVIVPSWTSPWRLAAARNLTQKALVNCLLLYNSWTPSDCQTQQPSYSKVPWAQSIFTCWCPFLFFHLRFWLLQGCNSEP